jgi:hypothetical protein
MEELHHQDHCRKPEKRLGSETNLGSRGKDLCTAILVLHGAILAPDQKPLAPSHLRHLLHSMTTRHMETASEPSVHKGSSGLDNKAATFFVQLYNLTTRLIALSLSRGNGLAEQPGQAARFVPGMHLEEKGASCSKQDSLPGNPGHIPCQGPPAAL